MCHCARCCGICRITSATARRSRHQWSRACWPASTMCCARSARRPPERRSAVRLRRWPASVAACFRLLLLALLALVCSRALSFVLARIGFYRLVWHPALFDLALFVIVLGGLASLSADWFY